MPPEGARDVVDVASGPADGTFPSADLLLLLVRLGEPARGHALGLGEEVHAVLAQHVQVAEEGVLVPREGEEGHRHRDADIDADHAGVGAARELAGVVTALGEDAGAVGEGAVVHDGQALFEVGDALDEEDRAEGLFLTAGHVLGDLVEDGRADEVAALEAGTTTPRPSTISSAPSSTPLSIQRMTDCLWASETTGPSSDLGS